jgi:hypothetical protein
MDHAVGMHPSETIYDDSDPDQIESIPPTALHRNIDLELVDADNQGMFQRQIRRHIPKAAL